MPVLSKGGDELFLGAKCDKVDYGASMSCKTSLVEALTSQSSKTSGLACCGYMRQGAYHNVWAYWGYWVIPITPAYRQPIA
jgi:hypothetical protein